MRNLPSQWPFSAVYEVFVQSFCDSNGDGIGDLNGLTSKLDYLEDLGVEALWLMPVHPSPSYHKYDVTDYYNIHSDYGTLDDFRTLIIEARARNIKVLIDLVVNHCSSRHRWFQDALSSPDNPYRDYFIWATQDTLPSLEEWKAAQDADTDNAYPWNWVEDSGEYYYSYFWKEMPSLNYDSPKLREEIFSIGRFWLSEIGVDGFRIDAAKHIYAADRIEEACIFWQLFKEKMQRVNPDVYLVGEVWDTVSVQAPFARGFSGLFNFDLAHSILESVNEGVPRVTHMAGKEWKDDPDDSLLHFYSYADKAFKVTNPTYCQATFLSNHDQTRILSYFKGNKKKSRLAASILFTLPGQPYLYYGDEIGMTGKKPDQYLREPFLWETIPDGETTRWMESKYNIPSKVDALDRQMANKNSLFHHYRSLLHLRRNYSALAKGELVPALTDIRGILAYYRIFGPEKILVLHNLTHQRLALIVAGPDLQLVLKTDSYQMQEDLLVLPAYASVLFQLKT